MVLVYGAPECPGAIHQIAVQNRTDECDRLEDSEHRPCLSGMRQENKSIQNGEIDNGVDDPNDSEAKDLHQVGVPRVDTWLGRIDQGNRAVKATIHLSSLKFVVFTNAIPSILVEQTQSPFGCGVTPVCSGWN